jgi:hypothetical protein
MRNQWQEFLQGEGERLVNPGPQPEDPKPVPPSETAALIRQGTLRALLLLSERQLSRDEAKRCAQQVSQLRRSLTQAENALRRQAGEPF